MNLYLVLVVAAAVALQSTAPANGQTPAVSPCTASMLTSFAPCMNILTNNTANLTTPTPGCCSSLMSLATNSSGCLCQILTGGLPFGPVPVNRTTAISLPKSCNVAGVPVQCNLATASPPASAPGLSPLAPFPGLSPLPAAAAAPAPTTSSGSSDSTSSPVGAPVSATTPTVAAPTSATTTTAAAPTAATGNAAKTSNPTTSAALALSPPLLILPLLLVLIKLY